MGAVLTTVKLAHHKLRKSKTKGSIVITGGFAGYWADPLVQASSESYVVSRKKTTSPSMGSLLAPPLPHDAIQTSHCMDETRSPIKPGKDVALALVYSATAQQPRRVETYGDEPESTLKSSSL
ncbi:hypothetical protein VMCG_07950 [Cytospora schulzeri]|uniref:Uncharacterized protein n=1 Tax=Cytospora schulzeri TaxID=448051 RepID=A0A423VY22_9PEZI|nr:hypothetical protein VMCG_07950 [Valsa malicola]